ncbi:MAG TPA: carboxymuconolactone decarboxylase family protein [Terriglobales bacterium]|nr:carboxymuconolactone decarboxylase family protein [Terriglobales bacterium]
MTRIEPLQRSQAKDFETVFQVTEAVMGFVPNSMLVMARDPDLLASFSQLAAIILVRPGELDPGLKALIMYLVSRSTGCQYCAAHTGNLAALYGVEERKVEQAFQFETSPEFSDAERAALRFAQASGQVPNAVSEAHFQQLSRYFSDNQIMEMVATLSLMAFLNRWNDTLATSLEAAPRNFAEQHLTTAGWSLGKHAGTPAADSPVSRNLPLKTRVFLWFLRRWGPLASKPN